MRNDPHESTSTPDGILRRPEVDPAFLKRSTWDGRGPLLVRPAAGRRAQAPARGAPALGVRPRPRPCHLSGSAQPFLEHQPRPLRHDPARLGLAGDRLHGRLQHGAAHRDGRPVDGGPVDPVVRRARRPPDQVDDENRGANPGIGEGDVFFTNDPWIGCIACHGRRHVRAGVLGGPDLLVDLQPVPRRRRRRSVPGELQPDRQRSLRGAGARSADQARPRAASCNTTSSRCTRARAERRSTSHCRCAARWLVSTPCRHAWPRSWPSTAPRRQGGNAPDDPRLLGGDRRAPGADPRRRVVRAVLHGRPGR